MTVEPTNHLQEAADRYNSVVQEFAVTKFKARPNYGVALSYAVDLPLLHEAAQANAKTDLEVVVGKLLPAAYDAYQAGHENWLISTEHDSAVPYIENTGAMNAGRIFGRGHSPNRAVDAATDQMRGIASTLMIHAIGLAGERELPFTNLLAVNYANASIADKRLNTMFFDSVFDTARLIAHAYVMADKDTGLTDGLRYSYYAEPLRECAKYLSADDRAEIIKEVVTAHHDRDDGEDDASQMGHDLASLFVVPPTRSKAAADGPVAGLGTNFGHLAVA